MVVKYINPKKRGFTLIEILITILILVLVIVGLTKSFSDFMLFMKVSRINSRAKELGEKLRSEIVIYPYANLKDCFNSTIEGTINFNGTLSFDNSTFYTRNCTHSCLDSFPCLYCYTGEEVVPAIGANCTVGYPIRVGYNAGLVIHFDNETGEKQEMGMALGIKIFFTEPKTKREKEINYLIFRKNEG